MSTLVIDILYITLQHLAVASPLPAGATGSNLQNDHFNIGLRDALLRTTIGKTLPDHVEDKTVLYA